MSPELRLEDFRFTRRVSVRGQVVEAGELCSHAQVPESSLPKLLRSGWIARVEDLKKDAEKIEGATITTTDDPKPRPLFRRPRKHYPQPDEAPEEGAEE